jgi:hypothetical protein
MQLWRERELLELLLFKLEEQQLLLSAGRSRWIQFAAREIGQVLERLQVAGMSRVVESETVAQEWGAPEGASLRVLIEHAPDGTWQEVFSEHLRALTQLTSEIGQLRDVNELQLRAALRATQETVASLGIDTGAYTTSGDRARDDSARIVDTRM